MCELVVQLCLTISNFVIPRTITYQTPLSMEFSRQEYWSGVPFPSPGDLPDPGIELRSPVLHTDSLPSEPPGKPLCFLFVSLFLFFFGGVWKGEGHPMQRANSLEKTLMLRKIKGKR